MIASLRILADQNINPEVVAWVRSQGLDITTVAEHGLDGVDDASILRWAVSDDRIVLTHDGDFGWLAIAAGVPALGILYLRPGHIAAPYVIESLLAFLRAGLDMTQPFLAVVVRGDDGVTIRHRRL